MLTVFLKAPARAVCLIPHKRLRRAVIGRLSILPPTGVVRHTIERKFMKIWGRAPNLDSPETFNEKLQWLKLHYRHPLMRVCTDKIAVREYVRDAESEELLIPVVGYYGHFNDLPLDDLPRRCVIKPNHTSGIVVLVDDSRLQDWTAARCKLDAALAVPYIGGIEKGEWNYLGIRPRLIVEAFIGSGPAPPEDYKVHCFHGEPRIIQVDLDRFDAHTRAFYDADWQRLPFSSIKYSVPERDVPQPVALDRMTAAARRLAAPFPYVRVDFYSVDSCVFFGEMIFFSGSGFERIDPEEWDFELGRLLDISRIESVNGAH